MTCQISVRLSAENRRWLYIASQAGFSMSKVINARLEYGQFTDLGGEVQWMVERRIKQLMDAGYFGEAQRLKDLLEAAQYPIGYH